MNINKDRIIKACLWLLPTTIEFSLYIFVCLLTAIVSNIAVIKKFLYFTDDFHPISAAVGSIDQLLTQLIGERLAGSMSLAIFWGLVGVGINIIWVVAVNFSTELNNDLVYSTYVHPRHTNPRSPLYQFITRSIFRFGVIFTLIFFLNYAVQVVLPVVTTHYSIAITSWTNNIYYASVLLSIIFEMATLHVIVILFRLLTLRKQLFSS